MGTAFTCTDVSAGYHPVDGTGAHETGTGAVNQDICTGQYTMAETSVTFNGKVIMDCTFCAKGYQFTSTTSLCTICPINMFQNSDSTASVTCTAVTAGNLGVDAAGDYVPLGAVDEAACPFGSYNDAVYTNAGSHNAGPALAGALSTSTSGVPTSGVVCLQTWSTCPAGKFVQTVASTSSNVVCTSCAEGEFKSSITPIGTLGTDGVTHPTGNGCEAAGPGHRASAGSRYTALGAIAKEKCAIGLYSTDGHLNCPGIVQAGYYQVDSTAGGATYESGTGAVGERVCPTGLYNIPVGTGVSEKCKMCGAGFKFVSKDADCVVCPVDTYNSAAAVTTAAVPVAVTAAVCTNVTAGKIAIDASGLYVLSRATGESPCNTGSFNTDGKGGTEDTLDCANPWVPCVPGTYPATLANTTRAADCQPCPDGTYKGTTTPLLSTDTVDDCTRVSVDYEAQAGNSHVYTGALKQVACEQTKFNDEEVSGFVEGPCEDCVQPVGYANASRCNTCANETAAGCLTGVCGSGFGRLMGLSEFACEACLNPEFNSDTNSVGECADVTCNVGMGQIPDGTTLSDGSTFVFDPNKDGDHNCQVCPKDSFSNTSSAGQCHAVDAGYYAGTNTIDDTWVDSGSTFQHPCFAGTYNTDGSSVQRLPSDSLKSGCSQAWTACPVGYHVKSAATTESDRECVICDAGKYNDVPSSAMAADIETSCTDIPDGHEGHNSSDVYPTNGVGATKIVPCPGGSIEPNGDGPCVNIPLGYEATNGTGLSTDVYAASGASGKRRCVGGTYNVKVNGMVSEACKYCAAGYEYTKTTTPCVICEIGEYQPSSTDSSVRCKTIGPGKQAIDSNGDYPLGGVGAVGREDCVPPEFNGNGLGRCGQKPIDPTSGLSVAGSSPQTWSPCGLGYYVSSEASPARDVTCTRCAAGTFRDSITSADPNTIGNVNQTNTCEDVPNGNYGADTSLAFVASVAGTAGASRAVPCPRNTYNPDGNGDCLLPGAGYHASNSTGHNVAVGAVQKVVCPDGTWNGGSTAGQGGTPGTQGCSETWTVCIPGTRVSVAASTTQDATCTACASGTYRNERTEVLDVDRLNQCDLISIGFQGQDGPLATDSYVATGASHQVACVAGTWNNDTTASCKSVRPGYVGVDASGQWQPTTAVLEEACGVGLYNVADDNGMVSTPCQYCAAGKEFMGQTVPCRTCVAGTYQKDSAVANVVCQSCPLDSETVNITTGDYIELAASGCVTCPLGEYSIRWNCDLRICQCDNGPASVGVDCPSHGAYQCADGSCIHPDTFLHVLKGKDVSKVRAGELRSGDLVIGEDSTSSVQRVERFTVADRGCIVPENLCQEKLNEKIVLSRNHAVRCPEWPRDNWMFCQEDWQREAVKEYVHVELENYMTDHLLSDSVVLESWDGYKRTTDEAPASCETGCPWPHDWEQSKQDPKKHIRVDLRKATNIDLRRMREGREVSDTGLKILRSYLAKK